MKHLKLFESFENIHEICKKYGIRNYTINDDGSIDVNNGVNLTYKRLTKLPLKFRNVSGYFHCSCNQLKSLEGCPESVGDFYCYSNLLTSLEGCPKSVVGNFSCNSNQLNNLEGFPRHIGGSFYCKNNPVYEIWKLFKDKEKIELFNDYDMIRGNSIILDRLNDFLIRIGKHPVENVKGYNNI